MTVGREELLQEFQEFVRTAATAESVMKRMAQRLHETMTRYNWVGFYLVDPADTGLCGAAAMSGQTVVVDDVSKDPRYLSGSPMVNSEIVVPIFVRNKLAAELDIESYFAGTFTKSEQDFVEACAAIVGRYIEKS